MDDSIKFFIDFVKRDDDQRIVEGYASTPVVDSQGEIVEKDAITNALSGYLGDWDDKNKRWRYGGIREMHQLSAVGKTIKAKVDDKGLYIEGKVVDDNAWKKVKEGVYAGFSIGGKVLESVKNRIKALKLNEISLVDRPANPEAIFTMVKIDEKGKAMDAPQAGAPQVDEVFISGRILDLAKEVRYLLNYFQSENKSTYELANALTLLKKLAAKVLTGDDKKKFEKIMYGMDFEEINKLTKTSDLKADPTKEEMDVKKFVDHTWKEGYFQDLKKVLG